MSASYDSKDGFIYYPYTTMDRMTEKMFIGLFDEQVDYDLREQEKEQEETTLLRKICLIKTIMFPIEFVLTVLLLDKKFTKEKLSNQRLYFQFLMKKMTLSNFKLKLSLSLVK